MNEANVRTSFAGAVRWWRKKMGITQEELAERADLHRTYISDVERGARNLSLESISKLAHALEVSVSTLFTSPNGERTANASGSNFVDILMVEDNPDDAEMALHAFRTARFANKVHVVNDGMEALDYLFCRGAYATRNANEHPQMMLLDLNLPKLSGIEVLRRIRSEEKTRNLPVIVLTVSERERDIIECRRLGVETYLNKPVNVAGLSQVTPQLNMDWALFKRVPPSQQLAA
jgi:CheY-like chemotaxis protein/DNA-binding XRE family transcriptional regulator